LPDHEFDLWCLRPLKQIANAIKRTHPDTPIIAFPRGAGTHLETIAQIPAIDGVGLDTSVDVKWAAKNIQPNKPVQGNLDPLALLAGGRILDERIDQILEAFDGGAHVFNLGHGILPQTPIKHVEQMLNRIRAP
jgi:uroporphyrinogen decarboxylase